MIASVCSATCSTPKGVTPEAVKRLYILRRQLDRCSAASKETQHHKAARRRYRKTVASASFTALVECDALVPVSAEQCLRNWIAEAGGFVHEGISVSYDTKCGDRGVVAVDEIPLEEAERCPLVIIPTSLYLSTDSATEILNGALGNDGRLLKDFGRLRKDEQLAMLLAHERSKGGYSFYAPYIDMLPSKPPCAWLMDEEELDAKLQHLRESRKLDCGTFRDLVASTRSAMVKQSDTLAVRFGRELSIASADIVWAMGQVLSRCFGNIQEGVGMAPYIDLMNHDALATKPSGYMDDDGKEFVFVPSVFNGVPRALTPGDEIFISYATLKAPSEMLMSFGFVP